MQGEGISPECASFCLIRRGVPRRHVGIARAIIGCLGQIDLYTRRCGAPVRVTAARFLAPAGQRRGGFVRNLSGDWHMFTGLVEQLAVVDQLIPAPRRGCGW